MTDREPKINHKWRCAGLILTVLTGAVTNHIYATERADTLSRQLDDIEYVGHRIAADISSAAPRHSLSSHTMKRMGVTDVADALHRLPGLDVRDYGGAGGLKTVSVRGMGASHTGVVYDGIALSNSQSGRIDLSRFSLDNVGELAMIVGDDADIFIPAKVASSAGRIVINSRLLPEASDSLWRIVTQAKVGSWGYLNPYLSIGKNLSPQLSMAVCADMTVADNDYPFRMFDGQAYSMQRRTNSRMQSEHAEIALRYRFGLKASLEGKAYYYNNNRQLPGQVVLYNPINNESLHERNFFSQLVYCNRLSDKINIKCSAKFNRDRSQYSDIHGKYPNGRLDEIYSQREIYASGVALYRPDENLSLSYAADWQYNNLIGNDPTVVNPTRHSLLTSVASTYHLSHISIMARALWSIYQNKVEKGIAAKNASKLSPSLSLTYRPWQDYALFFRASYKDIFRMPTFNESYYFHMGSTALKPEDTRQVNVGMSWQYNNDGFIEQCAMTTDGYINKVSNKIVAVPQNVYLWTMTNLDKTRGFGVDATFSTQMRLTVGHKLLVNGNYSFQRIQPRTNPQSLDYNKQVAYTPIHTGAVSLSWLNPIVDCVVHAVAVGPRYGTNANLPITLIGGYVDCGVTAMRTFRIFRNYTLETRADLMNVFNTYYEIVADYPMPGRSWRFTLTLKN